MAKRGFVSLVLTQDDARVAGNWLSHVYSPVSWTVLSGSCRFERDRSLSRAHALGAIFQKVGRRVRSRSHFETLISREDALWLAKLYEALVVGRYTMPADNERGVVSAPRSVMSVFRQCAEKAKCRRGNRRLTREKLRLRVLGETSVEERHRKRLARRFRYQAAYDAWAAAGGTLLTGPPPPEI